MPKYSDDWNHEPAQRNNNCYNYALDRKSTGKKGKNLNPGDASKKTALSPFQCKDVVEALKADKLDPTTKDGKCGAGCWKIVCLRAPKSQPDPDIHFYRQDDDGSWSHKRGDEKATNLGTDGKGISDPERDGKSLKPSYSELCGYFCVCPDKIKAIEVAMAAPQVGAQRFTELNTDTALALAISAVTIEVPKGKLVLCYDFAPEFDDAPIHQHPKITVSLFSLRPNPYWYLSSAQAERLVVKIKSLHLTKPAPSGKPFGGFRIDGIALTKFQYIWIIDKTVCATGLDGDEWVGVDTQGLDQTIRADFAAHYPFYQHL